MRLGATVDELVLQMKIHVERHGARIVEEQLHDRTSSSAVSLYWVDWPAQEHGARPTPEERARQGERALELFRSAGEG